MSNLYKFKTRVTVVSLDFLDSSDDVGNPIFLASPLSDQAPAALKINIDGPKNEESIISRTTRLESSFQALKAAFLTNEEEASSRLSEVEVCCLSHLN